MAALTPALVLGGCGKSAPGGTRAGDIASATSLPGQRGAAALATKNTTRIGGATPTQDAAAVALAVYPGLTAATRPQTVVLVDERDWPAALAASTLAGWPLHAPLLFTASRQLPSFTVHALAAMAPSGSARVEGAQTIVVGDAAIPSSYSTRVVRAADPAALAVSIEQLASAIRRRSPGRVIAVPIEAEAMGAPAAGLAAESGAPILFVRHDRVPSATAAELRRLGRPSIYLVGPTSVVDLHVERELRRLGAVTRIDGGVTPAENAVAVARYSDGTFGWGAVEPGHGLIFGNSTRPLDGPAAAALSATGDYAPLLLLEAPNALSGALRSYLSDLQPGTPPSGPVHGVYNHGWLIGDETAISAEAQARLDAILEISPRQASETEQGA